MKLRRQYIALIFFLNFYENESKDPFRKIDDYKATAQRIIDFTVKGKGKGQVWNKLAEFTDKFGPRLAGSQALENSIDYVLKKMTHEGLDNVHGEKAIIPHWVRGNESCELIKPRPHKISILGLGYSVGTMRDGIIADVIVVKSFDELKKRRKEVKGKIVIYNQPFVSYSETVIYRTSGASMASKYGAVASLIRSVTPLSIDSPHTGMQTYSKGVNPIPTACITVEDAEMLYRMSKRKEKIVIKLRMDAQKYKDVESRNTIAEIKGTDYPNQIVLISGHLDSWDVGQGAMDDGGGAFISWQALSIIKYLGLKPKRTIRAVLWTAEEFGMIGSSQYFNNHKHQANNFSLVMESDIGTFRPLGLKFTGSKKSKEIMRKILSLLSSINATQLQENADGGDVNFWIKAGVPGGSLLNENSKYFYFHHTNGDTMTVQNSDEMDKCAALWTVVAYVVASLDEVLPRE